MYRKILSVWRNRFSDKVFVKHVFFTIIFFLLASMASVHIISLCELRSGPTIHDFLLKNIPAKDVSTYIFLLTYSAILITILSTLIDPTLFIKGFQMYALLLFTRAIFILILPLNPPSEMVMMRDKIGNFLLNQNNAPVTKDLFFSGHTSTLFLMFLIAKNKTLKKYLAIICVIVPILLLIQHIHYTVDILAAPLFAYLVFFIVNQANKKTHLSLSSV